MTTAEYVVDYCRDLAEAADSAPAVIDALTLGGQAVGSHEATVKTGPITLNTFTESDWFTATADSLSSWLIVKGDLTIPGGVTLIPASRKLFTVVYVAGDLVLDGSISMTARGANHGPAGSDIASVPVAVTPSFTIAAVGGNAGLGVVSDAAAGGDGSSGVTLTSSGGGGGGGSRYNASYGGIRPGHGAAGTAFSGGPGGGGTRVKGDTVGVDGGERGGRGGTGGGDGFSGHRGGGGAGNPPYNDGGWANTGGTGTGGTLILLVEGTISGSGSAVANGVGGAAHTGDSGGGGGSGGGVVYVLSGAGAPTTMQVNGGGGGAGTAAGGAGGSGYAARSLIPPDGPLTAAPVVAIPEIGVTTIELNWSVLLGATSYEVRKDGEAPIAVGNTLTYTFTGLTTGTEYDFEVRGVNSHGPGPWALRTATPSPNLISHDEIVMAQASLWGFWKFEDGALADSSGLGRPAFALTGGTPGSTTLIAENGGPSVAFDGIDDSAALSTTAFNNPAAWTIAMVVSPRDNWGAYGSRAGTLWTHVYNGAGIPMVLGINSSGTNAGLLQAGFYNGAWRLATFTGGIFEAGKVYHLLASWDGTTIRLRVNGFERASNTPGSAPTANTTGTIRVARRWDGTEHTAVNISRVAVFTTALSSDVARDLASSALMQTYAPTAKVPVVAKVGLSNSIYLRWTAIPNVTKYIMRVNGGPVTYFDADVLSTTLADLSSATTYSIELYGINNHGAGPSQAFDVTTGTALLFDTYNRANSTNVPGTPAQGGPYTVRTGTWGINGNALYTSASTSEAHITFPAAVDFDVTLDYGVFGGNGGFLFRWVDANNTWLLNHSATQIFLYRRTAGTYNQVGTSWTTPMVGGMDLLRVLAVGRMIWVYKNGVRIMATEDGFYGAATATCGLRFSSDTATRLNEIAIVPGVLPGNSPGETYSLDQLNTDPTHSDGFIYKGRDTKLADEGAVA